ncbi:MAG: site-specific integrase [Burkholderiales bacterium]|nr:site-specific integrase [Burkholderiales bacterium]
MSDARPGALGTAETPSKRPAGVLPFPPAANRDALTVADLVDLYMAAYKGRDASRGHYLLQWCQLLGDRRAHALTADDVDAGMAHFAATPAQRFLGRDKATGAPRWKVLGPRSPATLNRLRSALSALLRYAKRQRWLPRGWVNPVLEVEALPEHNARTRFLTDAERERLLRACKLSALRKLHLLVVMALSTGARRGELLALTFGDLDLAKGTAYVRTSKNGQPRVLPLTAPVLTEIRRLGAKPADQLLFSSRYEPSRPMRFETAWRTALRQAGIEDFRFHDLRHSTASLLAREGASLFEVGFVLGHRDVKSTARYSHLCVDQKRELVERVLGSIGAGKAA